MVVVVDPVRRSGWRLSGGHSPTPSGLTKQREMDKMEERKHERRRKHMEALGLNWRRDRRVAVIKETRKIAPPQLAQRRRPRKSATTAT